MLLFCRSHSFVCFLYTSSNLIKTIISLAGDVFHSNFCENLNFWIQQFLCFLPDIETFAWRTAGGFHVSFDYWEEFAKPLLFVHKLLYSESFSKLFVSRLSLNYWLFLCLWMTSKQNIRDLNQQVNLAHNRLHCRAGKDLLDLKFCQCGGLGFSEE